MKSILICPDERPEVPLLAGETPLAMAPALGYGVLEYWMSHVACAGAKEVVLLAKDRPEVVRKAVGNGARWGLSVEVIAEPRELTPTDAAEKYGAPASLMDHFPGLPDYPLFASYERWFKALAVWMARARTPDRVGVRELRPGIWVGLHCRISRQARLDAPCWLGDHVYVGPGAVIGPDTILEKSSFIEPEAEIKNSIIGPATFVGRYMRISNSLAWGSTLVDWQTGLESTLSDAFMLCALHPRPSRAKAIPWLDRVAEWLALWKEDQPIEPQPILVKKGN